MPLPTLQGARRAFRPRGLARAYEHVFGGHGIYTDAKTKAILSLGLKRGFGPKEGKLIPARTASDAIFRGRGDQVGHATVAGTIFPTIGYYKGTREPSMQVQIAYLPGQERSAAGFMRNIRQLAERLAKRFDQREVLIEWEAPGKRGTVESATPTGAPSPTDPKFCAWVRTRSRNARTDSKDGCYEANAFGGARRRKRKTR